MSSKNRYKGLNGYVIKSVRKKAYQLTSNNYLSFYDQEDLEQEMMAYLLTRLPLSDLNGLTSECGIIKKLVEEKAKKLIKHAAAQKRITHICPRSLYALTDREEEMLILEIIPEHATFNEYACPHRMAEHSEQKSEIKKVIEKMPSNLGDLCVLLQEMTASEAQRIKGISHKSLYRSIRKIRQTFLEAEIKIFA